MSRRNASPSFRLPSWLRHRQMLTTEAVLLIAMGMELMQRWIASHHDVPWWLKTVEVMVVNGGLLGGLVLLLTSLMRGSLSGASRAVQGVPLPAPLFLLHLLAFASIFVLYARVWDFWPSGLQVLP